MASSAVIVMRSIKMSTHLSRRSSFVLMAALALALSGCRGSAMKKYTNSQTREEGFVSAAGAGDLEAVNEFLKAGTDVNARNSHGSTAMMDAAAGDHLEVVQALIAKGG